MSQDGRFTFALTLVDGYRFEVDFDDDLPSLLIDEPPPLGEGAGPNASRLLAAAVGNCLSASLLFCLRRARIDVRAMRTTVTGSVERNERGRLRIAGIQVRIEPVVDEDQQARMQRCLGLFEDFCVVTESVRRGIDVDVSVEAVSDHATRAASDPKTGAASDPGVA
jgi:organic hydroperoxide reductase OsmC/OhrA